MKCLTVGVPSEVKTDEHRVAITPDGVIEMTHRGARVLVEAGAGVDSSITDDDYPRGRGDRAARPTCGRAPSSSSRSRSRRRRSSATCGPTWCCSRTSTSPRIPTSAGGCSAPGTTGIAYETVQDATASSRCSRR